MYLYNFAAVAYYQICGQLNARLRTKISQKRMGQVANTTLTATVLPCGSPAARAAVVANAPSPQHQQELQPISAESVSTAAAAAQPPVPQFLAKIEGEIQRMRRTIYLLISVGMIFCICWLPLNILNIVSVEGFEL